MSQFQAGSARDIRKEAAWFRDTEGRYVLFRGVNFASRSKRPPYLPILPLNVTQLDESGAAQFDRELKKAEPFFGDMRQNGFNIVRLLVSWKAIEPRPNPDPEVLLLEGQHYLRLVGKIIDALYAHDIFVIIDFHQDIVHETCGGDGFPDWALAIDDQHSRPV